MKGSPGYLSNGSRHRSEIQTSTQDINYVDLISCPVTFIKEQLCLQIVMLFD